MKAGLNFLFKLNSHKIRVQEFVGTVQEVQRILKSAAKSGWHRLSEESNGEYRRVVLARNVDCKVVSLDAYRQSNIERRQLAVV